MGIRKARREKDGTAIFLALMKWHSGVTALGTHYSAIIEIIGVSSITVLIATTSADSGSVPWVSRAIDSSTLR